MREQVPGNQQLALRQDIECYKGMLSELRDERLQEYDEEPRYHNVSKPKKKAIEATLSSGALF